MSYCPNCGGRVDEADAFCRRCGFNIAHLRASLAQAEESVRAVIVERIDGIKRRDTEAIRKIVDEEYYTKFDDWPPFERQGMDGLRREAEALKVLKEYSYEISDLRIDILGGDVALASFIIKYRGKIRSLDFNVRSRVTMVLLKREDGWRLVHEHWSRMPEGGGWRERLL